MDFRLTEEQQLLRQTVREFAEREIRPHVREWDEAQHFPRELVPAMAALGLMGIQFPEPWGGAGMSAIDYCLCIEERSTRRLAANGSTVTTRSRCTGTRRRTCSAGWLTRPAPGSTAIEW